MVKSQAHRLRTAALLAALLLSAGNMKAEPITLVKDGRATCRIVVAQDASIQLQEAVRELREHLQQITGALIPDDASTGAEIVLGAAAAKASCGLAVAHQNLGDQGYIIRTVGERLVIAGATDLGTLYGVYAFLEDHLGVRWYTPDITKIPRCPTIVLAPIDERFVPAFESRTLLWGNCRRSIQWSSRMRVNCFIHSYGIHIREFVAAPILKGLYHFHGGHVHTMETLLPPDKYFDKNPEYFSEIDGKRIKAGGQPCLTNAEVIKIIAGNAKRYAGIGAERRNRIVSISQNDWGNPCRCSTCMASYKRKGLPQTYIEFVNDIAEHVQEDYPDVLVETLAYSWTREPPRNLRLNSNMLIRYAALSQCRRHGYQCEHAKSAHAKDWLDQWIAASPRVWVWYYSGGQSLVPWVNLNSFGPDFRHFAEVGAKGMFLEGSSWHHAVDMGDLKAYLLAKLSWNPNLDDQAVIREFIDYCYGRAAPAARKFIELINDDASYVQPQPTRLKGQGLHHAAGLLKREAVEEMVDACDRAEKLAAGDEALLKRIRTLRLSCDYLAILYLAHDDPRRAAAASKFFATAEDVGLEKFYSWDLDGVPWKAERYASVEEFRKAVDDGVAGDHITQRLARLLEPFYGGKLVDTVNLDTGSGPGWFRTPLHTEGDVSATAEGLLIGENSCVVYPGTRLGSMRYTPFTIELDVKVSAAPGEQTLLLAGGGSDHAVKDAETIKLSLVGQRVRVRIRSFKSGAAKGFARKQVVTDEIPDLFGKWRRLTVTYQNDASHESIPHVFVDGRAIRAAQTERVGEARITERFGWWKLGCGGLDSSEQVERFSLDPYYSVFADRSYAAVADCAPGLYRNVFFSNFIKGEAHDE